MDIFQEAEDIMRFDRHEEDRSNWMQFKVPPDAQPNQYKYAHHPPGEKEMVGCTRCYCIMMRLYEPYNDCGYWCLHCGPQSESIDYDR